MVVDTYHAHEVKAVLVMFSRAIMRRSRAAAVVAGIGFAMTTGGAMRAQQPEPPGGQASEHWELINTYCTDCHNFDDWAGGVAFDILGPEAIPQEAETFEKVVRKLRGHLMPPPGRARPEEGELYSFVSWLESRLDRQNEGRVRRVGVRRLNRKEYANAVRDLLAIEIDAAALLPQDDEEEGFDNIASALHVSPAFIEQYVSAAREIAEKAIGDAEATAGSTTYQNEVPGVRFGGSTAAGGEPFHVEGLPLGTRGGMAVTHFFPADGEYEINIADIAGALWVYNMEFENTLVVSVGGRKVYQTVIGGDSDMKAIDQDQDPAVAAINERLKGIRFTTEAGPQTVAVTFVRRTFAESDDRLHRLRQGVARGAGQDRVLRVSSFEISGPFKTTGLSSTPSRERIFSCYPANPGEEQSCAAEIISTLTERAFRRPITEQDVKDILWYYRKGRADGGFEEGIRMAVTGILASPDFLYRGERRPDDLSPGDTYRITDLELASRLSFFLWSSLPDDELRELAARGRLREPGVLEQQVRRMLADPRSETLATNFAYQWLHLSKMDDIEPDGDLFPSASGPNDPRGDFLTEVTMFVDSVLRADRSVVDLLTADHTFLNQTVAWQYGINDVRGDQFRRITLEDPARWGLLGKGAVLLASSYPNRTSPVLRGAYIMEHIIGAPPSAPPPDVEDNLDTPEKGGDNLTVREKLARHSTDPSCNSCHGIIDPLGFALENFDVDATWREIDRMSGRPIDAVGELPDGTRLDGPTALRDALTERPEQFVRTFTEKLMTYALGRTLEYQDMPLVREIVRDSEEDDYRFSSLVLGIVTSDAFQMQRVPEADEDGPATQAAVAEN